MPNSKSPRGKRLPPLNDANPPLKEKFSSVQRGIVFAVTASLMGAIAFAGPAFAGNGTAGQTAPVRQDGKTGYVNCVETGYRLVPLDARGIAPGPFCFNTDDPQNRDVPRIAPVNSKLTLQDLYNVEDTSVLSPDNYLGKDTFAGTPLTGNEPIDPYGREGIREATEKNINTSKWLTAANVGWGTFANENIPVLSTDSSNPNQQWVEIVSRDGRINNNPTNVHLMTGGVPIPHWYLAKPGPSGDKSLMVYDKATGITRSMFYLVKDADAQVYPATARFVVGAADNLKAAGEVATVKINYAGSAVNAGQEATSAAPTSDDVKQGGVQTREVTRSTKFSLGKGAPAGASVDPVTGAVTLTAAATKGMKPGTVIDVPIAADHPPVYSFASGGYIHGEKDFQGLGADNYWLNLRSGTSSVVGMQNELTQIGVDELLSGEINHAISMTWMDYSKVSSFPAKMADGSMETADFPHTTRAGQRFTLPDDFDVEKWAEQNQKHYLGEDKVMKMILKAAKKYGVIITDRNLFTNAFNFESPAGYAPYAREGRDVYKEHPEVKELMRTFHPYTFPLLETQWLEVDYAEKPGTADQAKRTETRSVKGIDFAYRADGREAYFPESLNSTTYAGEQPMLSGPDSSLGFSKDWSTHVTYWTVGAKLPDPNVSGKAEATDLGFRFIPKAGWTGSEKVSFQSDWTFHTTSNPGGSKLMHSPVHADLDKPSLSGSNYSNMIWNAHVVPRDQPIAREDSAWIQAGTAQSVDVLMNDEAYFGAGAAIDSTDPADMLKSGVNKIVLINHEGKEVRTYSDEYAEYKIVNVSGREHIRVVAKAEKQGFTKLVKYKAVTPAGKKSPVGYFQPKITSNPVGKGDVLKAPTAGNDVATTNYAKAVTVDVTKNDKVGSIGNLNGARVELKQADGSWNKTVGGASGSFAVAADGRSIVFTPAGKDLKQSVATYRITDSMNLRSEATLTVNLTGDKPVAVNDTAPASTASGKAVTIDVLKNDKPGKPGVLTGAKIEFKTASGAWVSELKSARGTYKVVNGKVSFQPAAGVSGSESVSYRITDSAGMQAEAKISTTVTASNKPVANPDTAPAVQASGAAVTINVLANDKPGKPGNITNAKIELKQANGTWGSSLKTAKGTYTVTAGKVSFKPAANVSGAESVVYRITDSFGLTGESKINVNVTAAVKPVAVADSAPAVTASGAAVTIDVLKNDKPGKPGNLTKAKIELKQTNGTWAAARTTAKGTYTVTAGKVSFKPAANVSGAEWITYRIVDSAGYAAEARINVNVTASVKPIAVADTAPATVSGGAAVTIDVLKNDKAGKPGNLTNAKIELRQANGTWGPEMNTTRGNFKVANGKVTFKPAANTSGAGVLTYRVTDSVGLQAQAQITVNVKAAVKPVAKAAVAPQSVPNGKAVVVDVLKSTTAGNPGKLTNAKIELKHPNGTWVTTSAVDKGTFKVANGKVTFQPKANAIGNASVAYQVTDSAGHKTQSTITAKIVGTKPVAKNDSATAKTTVATKINVAANDVAYNGLKITKVALVGADGKVKTSIADKAGTYKIDADGKTVVFTGKAGFLGKAPAVKYVATDSAGQTSGQATLQVNVVKK